MLFLPVDVESGESDKSYIVCAHLPHCSYHIKNHHPIQPVCGFLAGRVHNSYIYIYSYIEHILTPVVDTINMKVEPLILPDVVALETLEP